MFGLASLQIYGFQQPENDTSSTMKMPSNGILEKLIKNEFLSTNATISNEYHIEENGNDKDYIQTENEQSNLLNDNDSQHNQNRLSEESSIGSQNGEEIKTVINETTIPDTNLNRKNSNKGQQMSQHKNDLQKKKFIQFIQFLDEQNRRLEKELTKERRRRTEELSKVIRSLFYMEAKLKQDKKAINQKLYEKDNEINRLIQQNKVLRQKCKANGEDIEDELQKSYQEIEFCMNCRKKFYEIKQENVSTQTSNFHSTDERISKDNNCSSSDETLYSSFYGARRSTRYTSKRTFGTFRDYMKSRNAIMLGDDSNLENSEESMSVRSGFSRAMDRLHGIRRVESTDGDLDSDPRSSFGAQDEEEEEDDSHSPLNEEEEFRRKNKNSNMKNFAEVSPNQTFETSTDDWYASASDGEETETIRSKVYIGDAVNPVLECVNQILLQQSMEESANDDPVSLESGGENQSYSGNGSNTGKESNTIPRKRVHFSTKNSMVHVPRNDVDLLVPPTVTKTILDMIDSHKDNASNYESIYSNTYEPIGSENNSSNLYVDMESKSGHESEHTIVSKPKPPALPPKPANLMKIKKVLRYPPPQPPVLIQNSPIQHSIRKTESEPDYCSISEINETITSVQTVAEIHRPPSSKQDDDDEDRMSDTVSQKTEESGEEVFKYIPKLPNVAAIIVPKTGKVGHQENCATIKTSSAINQTSIPNILAEINKTTPLSSPSCSTNVSPTKQPVDQMTNNVQSLPIAVSPTSYKIPPIEDKLHLQAEFDWYNLDAEFGKPINQPDVIKATDIAQFEEINQKIISRNNANNQKIMSNSIEYNLDKEFPLLNQPDIIKENNNVQELKPITTNLNGTLIQDETPAIDRKLQIKKNFVDFIESSGLSTKPLPRKRKIYFSGPFV